MTAILADSERTLPDCSGRRGDRGRRATEISAAGSIGDLTVEILSRDGLLALAPSEWDELSRNAVADNPFYAATYVKGSLATIDSRTKISGLVFRSRNRELVGLFPIRQSFGVARAARNIYQFSGTPLVHRDHVEDVIAAWMQAMTQGDVPRCWQFTDIPLSGELYEAIARQAGRFGFALVPANLYNRPLLTRLDGGFEAHLASVLGKSRRKELERCLRRLREKGTLRLDRSDSSAAVAAALEAYLTLENAGWKGKAGTAFLARGNDRQFARAAFLNQGPATGAIIDTLLLDDRPIAISINLASGSTLFTPKCTYDETLRSYAPGLVLEYLVIERFYRDPQFERMDSATTVNGHVVQGLWNESATLGTLFVGPARRARRAAWMAATRARLISSIKALLGEAKGLLRSGIGRKPANSRKS